MLKTLIGLIFMVSPFYFWAHNPLSARYELIAGEQTSLLTISLSQDALNSALTKKYTLDYLNTIDQKTFQELIVSYLKTNFDVKIDGVLVTLEKGGVKLGSHQTDLKFVLPAFSKDVNKVYVHIPAFKENGKHQTIFHLNVYGNRKKIILSEDNAYRASMEMAASDASFLEYNNKSITGVGLVSVLFISILLYKRYLALKVHIIALP